MRSFLLGFGLLAQCAHAGAQNKDDADLGEVFGIVDQVVSVGFEPASIFVLQEQSIGSVLQYKARAVPLDPNANPGEERRLVIAAPVLIRNKAARDPSFHFTFFMASRDAAFAATAVRNMTLTELQQSSVQPSALRSELAELDQRLRVLRVEAIDLEEKLTELRKSAAAIAPVDAIIDLKMKLEGLQAFGERKSAEIERIEALITLGRSLKDPSYIDALRQELATDLSETAQVTALADRLDRRKRDAAMQDFQKKLTLVKEMQAENPQSLAKEVLRLRKKRRDLERRLGLTGGEPGSDDF